MLRKLLRKSQPNGFLIKWFSYKRKRVLQQTLSVLMSLSRLAGVGNFSFNLLLPFLSIVRILSSQAILFQILLCALFPWFHWLTLLLFPSYFKIHNLT